MTKKRFNKLCRAYFTKLNEWAKETGRETLPMGQVYRRLHNINNHLGTDASGRKLTRQEWWNTLTSNTSAFGVGEKKGVVTNDTE